MQNISALHDSSTLSNNVMPVIHDTVAQPEYAEEVAEAAAPAVAYDDMSDLTDVAEAPFDPMAWVEEFETPTQTWNTESMMTALDAPPSEEMPPMVADQEMTLAGPTDIQAEPEIVAESYADVEPEAPVEFQAPVRIPTPVEVDEGTFAGQTIEFESFMFNGGRTSSPALMNMALSGTEVVAKPAPAPQPPAPVMQAPAPEAAHTVEAPQDELPFWLKGTGELALSTVDSPVQEPDAVMSQDMPTFEVEAPVMDMAPAPQTVSEDYIDYSDLPPIDPFDFSLLGLSVEDDEGLGFNTQELSGYSGANYDLMTATADLQVVADILGTDPDLQTMPSEPLQPHMATSEVEPFAADVEPALHAEAEAESLPISALTDDGMDDTPGSHGTLIPRQHWTLILPSDLTHSLLEVGQLQSQAISRRTHYLGQFRVHPPSRLPGQPSQAQFYLAREPREQRPVALG